jgi:hypothetical protein
MPKIEIDVDHILTSAVALEIEPGDHLLVMNGVVIGMVEKRGRRLAATTNGTTPPEPEAPKRRNRPTFFPPATIMDVLRKHDGAPMSSSQIIDAMSKDRTEPFPERDRKQIAKIARQLRAERKIGVVDEAERFPRYRLLP